MVVGGNLVFGGTGRGLTKRMWVCERYMLKVTLVRGGREKVCECVFAVCARADSRECEVCRVSKGIGMLKKGGGGREEKRKTGKGRTYPLAVRVSDGWREFDTRRGEVVRRNSGSGRCG